jgi:sugar lactone lactonase YvrE
MSAVAVTNSDFSLAECPLWDEHRESLFWVDITRQRIHELLPSGNVGTTTLPVPVGAIGLADDATLVAAAGLGFWRVDPEAGSRTEVATIDADSVTRLNDGACDPWGRFLAGTIAEGSATGTGCLYAFDGEHVDQLLDGVGLSNGIAWATLEERAFYVDSRARVVEELVFDCGSVAARRPLFEFERDAIPDGLTTDTEGGIWIAFWGLGQVRRYEATGECTDEVRVPTMNTTSCTFGESDYRTLFITTASGPDGGGTVYAAEVPYTGAPPHRFAWNR